MSGHKQPHILLVAVFALATPHVLAQAQYCASVATHGNFWTDDSGNEWELNQGLGTTAISGFVTVPATPTCNSFSLKVNGKYLGNGSFQVGGSTGPPSQFCLTSISYTGTIDTPACDTGSGTYVEINIANRYSGSFNWSMPCLRPNGETTPVFAGWLYETIGQWNTAVTPSAWNFGGRTVTESGGGTDDCWFQGSAIPSWTIAGDSWPIAEDGTNVYGTDDIGFAYGAVYYYRTHHRAPCGATLLQKMFIDCPNSPPYITNTLGYVITATTVTSSRTTTASASRTWVPNFIESIQLWLRYLLLP